MDNRHLPWRRIVREKGVICRACAKYRECSFNIFISTDAFIIPIFHLLRDLLNVEVAEGDGLPDTICRLCVNKLVEFNEFRQIYVSSETELRKRSEFKWLLEEEIRPWEEFAEEESFLDDGSQGVSAANLKSELNEIGIVHLVKEEEMERNTVTAEEVKKETDSAEDLDSGQTSTSNVDPYRDDRCNNIGRLTEELEKEFGKFGADRQRISKDKLLNDPSFDHECEEIFQLEYSMANHFVADCFPEKMLKKQKKNVIRCTSSKEFSPVNDRARPVRNQECGQFCHQSENTSYSTHYICNYCSTSYSQKNSLARHIKRHVDGKKSAIVLPKKEFPPRFSQYLLEKGRGNIEPVILETSNMSCMQKGSRRKNEKPAVEESSRGEHLGRELCSSRTLFIKSVNPQDKAVFVCDTCGIEFLKKCDLAKHVNVHIGLIPCCYQQKGKVTLTYFKPLRCDLCGKYFKNTKDLKRHSGTHAAVKPFKCNECGKMFTTIGSLKAHSVVHTGVKKFKCNECGKMFARKSDLKTHLLVHTGVRPFKCNVCGKMFTSSSNLNKHSVVHTGVKKFKCKACGKMFAHNSTLNKHSVLHIGVKAFKCNECGKMFARKSSLNTHLLVHTGVRPFKCNECGKMFSQSSSLKAHSVVHTDVKKFKCNECGKMFTTSGSLKAHSVVHTDVKKFKCNECGKMFTQSGNLKMHSVIHTGVKPFKCNECGKMFTHRSSLNVHSRIHFGVMPFKCDFCGKQFRWRNTFNRHLLTHADRNPSK